MSAHPVIAEATKKDSVEQKSMATHGRGTKVNDLQVTDTDFTKSETSTKKSRNGVVLVPQPSDDPRDPLVCFLDVGSLKFDRLI